MNIKSACKTAIILSIVSMTLKVFGQSFSTLMIVSQMQQHNGGPYLPSFLMLVLHAFWNVLSPALLIAGFITLLSAYLKQHNDLQANIRSRSVTAAVLMGIGGLLIAFQAISFLNTILRHPIPVNFQYMLSFAWYAISIVSVIALCLFAITMLNKSCSKIPAVTAVICYLLHIVLMIFFLGNTVYQGLGSDSSQFFGELFTVFWFASSVFSFTGGFCWLAAVLMFLFAWPKQKPWPPHTDVLRPNPQPSPILSAEQSLPE